MVFLLFVWFSSFSPVGFLEKSDLWIWVDDGFLVCLLDFLIWVFLHLIIFFLSLPFFLFLSLSTWIQRKIGFFDLGRGSIFLLFVGLVDVRFLVASYINIVAAIQKLLIRKLDYS